MRGRRALGVALVRGPSALAGVDAMPDLSAEPGAEPTQEAGPRQPTQQVAKPSTTYLDAPLGDWCAAAGALAIRTGGVVPAVRAPDRCWDWWARDEEGMSRSTAVDAAPRKVPAPLRIPGAPNGHLDRAGRLTLELRWVDVK